MRALLLPALLLLSARTLLPALLLLSARALPSAPPPAPLLLVARSACRALDARALALGRLERYAAESARASQLPAAYRLLGHEETCGAGWQATVARRALAALGAGGGAAVAGRLGARVCGAVGAAAAALRRPQPAPCGEARARGAVLAHLALRLRWRRALVAPPARAAPECEAALLEAERALAAAGVAVRRPPGDSARAPHGQ
ncbi:uncharacterized protein [Maniola hyperantus]|uniref:uncharacterized protein n=1 Tax=Aphantopus hyperantus TaxID=2795564 RepID=UPI003747F3A0